MKKNLKILLKKFNKENYKSLNENANSFKKGVIKNIKKSILYNSAKKKLAFLKIELDILNRKLYVLNKRKIYPYLSQKKLIFDKYRKQ